MDLNYNVSLLKSSYEKFNFKKLNVTNKYRESISGRKSDTHYLIEVEALCPCGILNVDGFILNEIGLFEYNSHELFTENLLIEHLRKDGFNI